MTDPLAITKENNDAEMAELNPSPYPAPDNENIQKNMDALLTEQQSILDIKKHVDLIIESIAQNKSFLTRAAAFWGNRPLWQKIIAGVVLIVPTLIIGIVLQIAIPIVTSVLTLILYTATSYILDHHHDHENGVVEKLKSAVTDLVDMLKEILEQLDVLRQQLAKEIEYFQKENDRLTQRITELNTQINTLMSTTEKLQNTHQELRTERIRLEEIANSLNISIDEYKKLFSLKSIEIEQTEREMQKNQDELSTVITELKQTRSSLTEELDNAKKMSHGIEQFIKQWTQTSFSNETQRADFLNNFEQSLKDVDGHYSQLAQSVLEVNKEWSVLNEQLKQRHLQNELLLEREAIQVERLEKLFAPSPQQETVIIKTPDLATMLATWGIYANPNARSNQQKGCQNLGNEFNLRAG